MYQYMDSDANGDYRGRTMDSGSIEAITEWTMDSDAKCDHKKDYKLSLYRGNH